MHRKILLAASVLLFAETPSFGATLYWDGTDKTANADGGNGTWDTSTPNWQSAQSGGTATIYGGAGSAVVFGGTAGVVQPIDKLAASDLRFTTTGYELTGGSLLFLASGPILTDPGVVARIDSMLRLFTGTLSINGGGKLILGNTSNAFSFGDGVVVSGNTTLEANDFAALSSAKLSFGNGGGTLSYTGATAAFNDFNASGLGSGNNTFLITQAETTVTLATALSAGGGGFLIKDGNGELRLTGANTYSAATTIAAGTLTIGASGSLGGGSYATSIANNGTFQYSSTAAQTISGVISGSGTLTQNGSGALTLTGGNTYTGDTNIGSGSILTVGGSGSLGLGNYNGAISNDGTLIFATSSGQLISGAISGVGTLMKSGAGSLALQGSNTYSGTTTVSNGILLLITRNTGGGAISVASGAVLGGSGSTASAANIAGGGILLGGTGFSASGKLSLGGNVTLASGAIIQLAVGASGSHSSLAGTGGTWAFDGTQKFNFIDMGAGVGTYSGLITGISAAPASINNWTIANKGFVGSFKWNAGTQAIDLVLTAVPEPSTYGLLGAGMLAAVAFVRHRKRHAVGGIR